MTMWEKQILTRAIRVQNENWGNYTFFSERIELKFGNKLLYILCILKPFLNYGCLIMSENAWLPTFSVLDSNTLAKI